MEREWLEEQLGQGKSLAEIAELAGKDPSTVGYWVKKHGLTANGRAKYAARGGLTREELEPLVNRGATLCEIASELNRSMSTVRYWIDRHGLSRPITVRKRAIDDARAAGHRVVTRHCPRHGETTFVIENSGRVRCRRCRMERVSEWRRRAKCRLIDEAGGRCRLCGYDRCPAALEFHHLDPSTKEFALSHEGAARAMAVLRAEAAKCDLLCANCHAEVEVGFSRI